MQTRDYAGLHLARGVLYMRFMRKHIVFTKLVLLAAIAVAPGCFASTDGQMQGGLVVYSDPPPPRATVVVQDNPGYVWVDGQWMWSNDQWVWQDGYWQADRPGYAYVQGYWQPHGRGRTWVAPYWRRGGNGYVRTNPVYVHERAPVVRGTVQARPVGAPAVQVHDHGSVRGKVIIRRDHGRR
jgi:hypothetical protein